MGSPAWLTPPRLATVPELALLDCICAAVGDEVLGSPGAGSMQGLIQYVAPERHPECHLIRRGTEHGNPNTPQYVGSFLFPVCRAIAGHLHLEHPPPTARHRSGVP